MWFIEDVCLTPGYRTINTFSDHGACDEMVSRYESLKETGISEMAAVKQVELREHLLCPGKYVVDFR